MLKLYDDYSREDAHSIFDPLTTFTPQAGTWGIQGIVPISDRPGDFVFFVTYGKTESGHTFDESISAEGVLSWQSQPKQRLADNQIQNFISHDELSNSIYLFLRCQRDRKYSYLGRLKYLTHDSEREAPVHFQWQILEGPPPIDVCGRIGIELLNISEVKSAIGSTVVEEKAIPAKLLETDMPAPFEEKKLGISTEEFKARKAPNYAERDKKNRELGWEGEILILEYEISKLNSVGRSDLAEKVRHVSFLEGDGAGYDILSYDEHTGDKKYIEVKTTKDGLDADFYLTSNELNFSRIHFHNYVLYRVYDFITTTKTGKFYIIKGDLNNVLHLVPQNFVAKF